MTTEAESTAPLIDTGWNEIDDLEDQVSEYCTVSELLKEHPHDVVRYLQQKGVAKLGEFSAPVSSTASSPVLQHAWQYTQHAVFLYGSKAHAGVALRECATNAHPAWY